jgi:hypothetical protein
MAVDMNVSDNVTVTEVIYPLLGIGVAEHVVVSIVSASSPPAINVHDNVALSMLLVAAEAITIAESVTVSFPGNGLAPNVYDELIAHDDGHGVGFVGSGTASVLIVVSDSVALVLMTNQFDTVTITESVTGSIGTASGALSVNVSEAVTVTEQAWTLSTDYVFVTESVSVYFRQVNTVASDAVAVAEQVALLVQGGAGTATIQILTDDVVVIEEAVTTGLPPMPNVFSAVLVDWQMLAIVPRQPQGIDSVTIAESVTMFLPVLVPSVSESVTAADSVEYMLNPMPIVAWDDVRAVEDARIGREPLPWEPGAIDVSTWDGSPSASDTWEEAAPAATGAWA